MLLSGKLTFDLVPFACFVLGVFFHSFVFPISYGKQSALHRMRIIQCSYDGICLDRLSVLNILFDT